MNLFEIEIRNVIDDILQKCSQDSTNEAKVETHSSNDNAGHLSSSHKDCLEIDRKIGCINDPTNLDGSEAVVIDETKVDHNIVIDTKSNIDVQGTRLKKDELTNSSNVKKEESSLVSEVQPILNADQISDPNKPCIDTSKTVQDYTETAKRYGDNEVRPEVSDTSASKSQPSEPDNKENQINKSREREESKLTMYKALAVKLKRELVKTKEELIKMEKLRDLEIEKANERVEELKKCFMVEKNALETVEISYHSQIEDLKQKLKQTEFDLESLHAEFNIYKEQVAKMMQQQQNSDVQQSTTGVFLARNDDEIVFKEKYVKMRELSNDQKKQIDSLTSSLEKAISLNGVCQKKIIDLEAKSKQLESLAEKGKNLEDEYIKLTSENEVLRAALQRSYDNAYLSGNTKLDSDHERFEVDGKIQADGETNEKVLLFDKQTTLDKASSDKLDSAFEQSNGFGSGKHNFFSADCNQRNDSEDRGDHSVEGNINNGLDELKRAYKQSEDTNSLLKIQIGALKAEIRRIELSSERMELANKLEYLKNIVLKFISLDNSSQAEQRQRLVPVLCSVLKLSRDESAMLSETVAKTAGKTSVSGSSLASFFM